MTEETRDPFAASNNARTERDRVMALTDTVAEHAATALTEDELSSLPGSIQGLLSADDRHFWPLIGPDRRSAMLLRAHRRTLLSAERNLQRAIRQDTCGNYIDLLCLVINTSRKEIGDEAYDELKQRYLAAKDQWEQLRKTSRSKTGARVTSDSEPDGLEDNKDLVATISR
jgi:hypothetical protein